MQMILVSRCLLGHRVRYDGGAHGPYDVLARWQAEGRVIALCPEVAGGLPTPRPAAEIPGGQGAQVLDGLLPVVSIEGEDFTAQFVSGAEQALALVKKHDIAIALLKARSPSCGNIENYDGSFSGNKVAGEGVTAALLRRAGVAVFNEEQLDAATRALARLELD
ncbi:MULTISPECIES: DUF523 domain-containing protein [Pseudomonas]|uniref:Uncharacterized conserved protein YbbK, DUF523 family n=1 Tax=Pseudomonas segetis TaxID=298908 RepID=A0A239ILZ4_9PSED|nr:MULTISPECIES: DUF523 domain-containing protein [Pseudomonas]SNS93434.1 Uncharacterized conserved protein YbbK, DUF523 family [Pseudomonas segetis]